MPFGKESTVSSPAGDVSQQLLCPHGAHHHKKKAEQKPLVLNSSQVHLIAGSGNSSSTLSDVSTSSN